MSAAQMDVTWDWQSELEVTTERVDPAALAALVRQPGPRRGPARCPECQSIVYSRRNRLCGVCSQPLPDHLLFTLTEMRRIEQLLRTERERHRQWLEQREVR